MWAEINRYLPEFPSMVLTALDTDDQPFSLRVTPVIAAPVIRLDVAEWAPLIAGPANLLGHRHDKQLANQRSIMLRGRIAHEDGMWVFYPERFIDGAAFGDPWRTFRAMYAARQRANAYLKQRGLPRPKIPWDQLT